MAAATKPPQSFASRLRAEMTNQGLSIKGLARRIDPENVERARRNIHRWLDEDITPQKAKRRDVAVALGLDEHALDEDDEEADPVADLVNAVRDLVAELRAAK